MEYVICTALRGYILFYITFNLYLIFKYIKVTEKVNLSEVVWLLFFGFMIVTYIGIEELNNDWENY